MSDSNSPSAADEAEHQALRAMRDAFVAAFNRADIDAMLALVDEKISFTFMDGQVGHCH